MKKMKLFFEFFFIQIAVNQEEMKKSYLEKRVIVM